MTARNRLGFVLVACVTVATACPPPAPSGTPWIAPGSCYMASSAIDTLFLEYLGPENTAQNVRVHDLDGSRCDSPTGVSATVVRAPDQASADARCASLTPTTPVGASLATSAVVFSPAWPADAWGCSLRFPIVS